MVVDDDDGELGVPEPRRASPKHAAAAAQAEAEEALAEAPAQPCKRPRLASPERTEEAGSTLGGSEPTEQRGGSSGSSSGGASKAAATAATAVDDAWANGSGEAAPAATGMRPKVHVSDDLPVRACREEILAAVRQNRVVVIVGETGSGKTTQVPKFLHEAGIAGPRGVVAVTQPRRIAAISVANRVAAEMGCEVGGLVGFHVRFSNRTSRDTRLKYMTDGMLVRECAGRYGLRGCGVVVLDEAHERSVDTDVLLGLVKLALDNNDPPGLRVVIMSATLSTTHFVDFFGGPKHVKSLFVPGRQHPVKMYYTPTPEPDFLEAALVAVLQLHISRPPGDVLVFLPGQEDIDGLQRLLEEKRGILAEHRRRAIEALPEEEADGEQGEDVATKAPGGRAPHQVNGIDLSKADDFVVRPIYAALPFDQQELVFEPAPPGCRKVVLATNIAETSITIPGIRYVVDSGFMKLKICHPQTGVEVLKLVETSQASAKQRAGRAGREAPGEAYRLYVEAEHARMPAQTPAEILRCELASVYLQLKALGIQKILDFPLVDRPPQEALVKAAHLLRRLGALDHQDTLTEIGKKLAVLPVHPMYAYCLLVSLEFSCTSEMLSIIAMISADTPVFVAANRKQKELAPQTKPVLHDDGDHLSLLTAYTMWKKASNKQSFARQHSLNHTALERAATVRGQLKDLIEQTWGVKSIGSCGGPKNYHIVRRALLKGCFMQTARRDEVHANAYQTLATRQVAKLHPQSVLFRRQPPPACVVYTELVTTTKNYLRTVTEVDPSWLAELCPQYFAATPSA
mmetsp:Transcript_1773/g.6996  ORF Transcript_1773/g.6996 Transcript_1773/m.6996 type:complete len:798 (+) Transcript_1773:81-2474(+)